MMTRRHVVLAAGAVLVASPAAWAQEVGRTYRLGVVVQSSRSVPELVFFFEELRRFGFIEGDNLSIVGEFGVTPDRADAVAAAVVKAGPDVIFATGEQWVRATQRATKTIPIYAFSGDLVGQQLVASMAHPEGNTTGISFFAAELDGKRFDILIDMLPGIRRIAALVDPSAVLPARLQALAEAAEAAGSRDVTVSIHRAGRAEEIIPAIDAALATGVQALNVLGSPLIYVNRGRIIEHVATVRLPTIYQFPEWADEGGLVAYGPRVTSMVAQQIVPQLVKLLRGAKPADVPVEQPNVIELVVNLKTAKALGLTIPPSLLARVNEVIE